MLGHTARKLNEVAFPCLRQPEGLIRKGCQKGICELAADRRARVDKVAAVVITSGYHFFCPQLIRGADGTAFKNRCPRERFGLDRKSVV